MSAWRQICNDCSFRRLISLSVLASFCAAVVPLPMAAPPASNSPKDLSTPFPCQDRPCGCRSAEQCWKSCCCFSNVEKVAWATQNGVQLPESVTVEAARETGNKSRVADRCCDKLVAVSASAAPADKTRPRASAGESDSVCDANSTCAKCCSETKANSSEERSANRSGCKHCLSVSSRVSVSPRVSVSQRNVARSKRPISKQAYAIGLFVQKCQGLDLTLNVLPWAVLQSADVEIEGVCLVAWIVPESVTMFDRSVDPPEPPPRLTTATGDVV